MKFEVPPAQEIPFFDHGSTLGETIHNSSARRNMNPLKFTLRKIRNIMLMRMSYFCPLNSMRVKMNRWRGVHIGKNVYIGTHCVIDNAYPEYVFIEDNASLAGEVTIVAHANPYSHFEGVIESKVAPVVVREGAWVSVKCTLLHGADIGKCAIVSAGSVVSSRVPDYTMVVGNPAKKVYNFEHITKEKYEGKSLLHDQ